MKYVKLWTILPFCAAILLRVPCLAEDASIGCFTVDAEATDTSSQELAKLKRDGVRVVAAIDPSPSYGKLLPGDVIVSIDGKSVTNQETYNGVFAQLAPGKDVDVVYYRLDKDVWQSNTITLKLSPLQRILNTAMKGRDEHRGLQFLEYHRLPTKNQDAVITMRVYLGMVTHPVLCALYLDTELPRVEKFVVSSKAGSFELDPGNGGISEYDLVKETAEIHIPPERLAEFKKIVGQSPVTVTVIGNQYKKDFELDERGWVGVNTAVVYLERRGKRK